MADPNRERVPRNGLTIRQLAERTGYTPRTIKAWTSEPRAVYLTRAEQRREAIRALHDAEPGLSMRAIGERLGCSAATVCRALADAPSAS